MTTVLNYGLIVALFLAWVGLFAVKDASREAASQIVMLDREIARNEEAIGILATDWAILNEPGYLQSLAEAHLGLSTMSPNQIVTLAALPQISLIEPSAQNTGVQFAQARGYRQFSSSRGTAIRVALSANNPYADWAHPALRPEVEG